jgi:hypothetical protein
VASVCGDSVETRTRIGAVAVRLNLLLSYLSHNDRQHERADGHLASMGLGSASLEAIANTNRQASSFWLITNARQNRRACGHVSLFAIICAF